MPSGPKKRRAAKRKNDAKTSSTNSPDEQVLAADEISANVSNVVEMAVNNVDGQAGSEKGLKDGKGNGPESVDVLSTLENVGKSDDVKENEGTELKSVGDGVTLETPLTIKLTEDVGSSDDVLVLGSKKNEAEECSHDPSSMVNPDGFNVKDFVDSSEVAIEVANKVSYNDDVLSQNGDQKGETDDDEKLFGIEQNEVMNLNEGGPSSQTKVRQCTFQLESVPCVSNDQTVGDTNELVGHVKLLLGEGLRGSTEITLMVEGLLRDSTEITLLAEGLLRGSTEITLMVEGLLRGSTEITLMVEGLLRGYTEITLLAEGLLRLANEMKLHITELLETFNSANPLI